ncbi:MAG: hypothetical protein WCV83_03090 [Candidatus Magasanikbacteria bacterium]|jgi:hypothetical protein
MPNSPIIEDGNNEPAESVEDLRDSEFEENLDEYGDGNQEGGWGETKEEKDSDDELDDENDAEI